MGTAAEQRGIERSESLHPHEKGLAGWPGPCGVVNLYRTIIEDINAVYLFGIQEGVS